MQVCIQSNLYRELKVGFARIKREEEFMEKCYPVYGYQIEKNWNISEMSIYKDNSIYNHNYFLVSRATADQNKISWLEYKKIEDCEDKEMTIYDFRKKYGKMTKIGRFLTKFFELSSTEIQIISDIFKRKEESKKFNIVEGEYIKNWYNANQYAQGCGTLNTSCMRSNSCQSYFSIYTENRDKVKMLILTNEEDKLIGRALLWYDVYFPNLDAEKIFMDRIYGTDETIGLFKQYAEKNDIVYKTRQSYEHKIKFTYKGTEFFDNISIELEETDFSEYPYLDTMSYLDSNYGILYNDSGSDYDKELCSTSGGISNGSTCTSCGDRIDEGDEIEIDDGLYCQYCVDNEFVYSERNDRYILQDEAHYCEECGAWHLIDDVRTDDFNLTLCDWCFDSYYHEINGEFVHTDDCRECEYCGELHKEDNLEDIGDFEDICPDCKDLAIFADENGFEDMEDAKEEFEKQQEFEKMLERTEKLQIKFNFPESA